MRNLLTNHRVDLERVISWAIQTCLTDDKACMSMSVNKWVGWLSKVKLASDLWSFWYICDPTTKWHNWQTTWYRITSTVYDEYWERWEYDDSWTRIDTLRKSQWGYSDWSWWAIGGDFWVRDVQGMMIYLPKWWERWRQSYYRDNAKWGIIYGCVWNGWKTILLFHSHAERWREASLHIYPLDTATGTWWVYSAWSSTLQHQTKCYETDTKVRVWRISAWNTGRQTDFRWWRFDVDKTTWQPGTVTSITKAEYDTYTAAHPQWYYTEDMTLLTNYEEYSWGCYFNWNRVWESWYFQRGRDNKAMEYIFRPVNLVQSSWSSTQWAAIQ